MFEFRDEVKVHNLNALSEQAKINDTAVRHSASNASFDDAAASDVKHPLLAQIVNAQQTIRDTADVISSMQGLREQLVSLEKKIAQVDKTSKDISAEGGLRSQATKIAKELNTVGEKVKDIAKNIEHNHEKTISTAIDGDSISILVEDIKLESLEKVREAIEQIKNSENFLLGVQNRIEEFSTEMQFGLEEIMGVEQIIKDRNMSQEIGIFSLGRLMERAHEALRGQANRDPDTAVSLLKPPKENIIEAAVPEAVTLETINEGIE